MFTVFKSTDHLPKDITAHDLLKTFAIVLMMIDHVGYMFFPYIEELRLIGRLSAPIWFFLIGYSNNRELEPRLWIGSIILFSLFFIFDSHIFPFHILLMFLFIRLALNPIAKRAGSNFEILFGMFWLLSLLIFPTMHIVEYGTAGLLFALAGYLVRHRDECPNISQQHALAFMALTCCTYMLSMIYWFEFWGIDTLITFVMLLFLGIALMFFEPKTLPKLTTSLGPAKHIIFMTGRRTLEIYVLHLVLFKMLSEYINNYGLSLF